MSGWKSTKSGKHFRTGTKPGISSGSNNHSNNSGSQPSSVRPTRIFIFRTVGGCAVEGIGTNPADAYKDAKAKFDNTYPEIREKEGKITSVQGVFPGANIQSWPNIDRYSTVMNLDEHDQAIADRIFTKAQQKRSHSN